MKKFLVATANGGLMEQPEITYDDYQIIEANDSDEACEIYDRKNNCSFFHGECIGEYNEKDQTVAVPISIFMK